jgi:hypothetical protein
MGIPQSPMAVFVCIHVKVWCELKNEFSSSLAYIHWDILFWIQLDRPINVNFFEICIIVTFFFKLTKQQQLMLSYGQHKLKWRYKFPIPGSHCGSAVKWWKWENKWNLEDRVSSPPRATSLKKQNKFPRSYNRAGFEPAIRQTRWPLCQRHLLFVSGDSIVLWKQGDRVISAGPIQVSIWWISILTKQFSNTLSF